MLVWRELQGWSRGAETMSPWGRPFLGLAESWGLFNFNGCITPKISLFSKAMTSPAQILGCTGQLFSSLALFNLFEPQFGLRLKGVRDVDQLNVSKPDQEVQQTAVLLWNISEIRGSGVCRGARMPQYQVHAADFCSVFTSRCIPQHPYGTGPLARET